MGRNRCPNCRKRVPQDEPICPRCGQAIALGFEPADEATDPALYDGDEWSEDPEEDLDEEYDNVDDGIDDPELLAQAEARVRALPLYDLAGMTGTYAVIPDDQDVATAQPQPSQRSKVKAPAPTSEECPACGRQAQKGWETCPWCGAVIP